MKSHRTEGRRQRARKLTKTHEFAHGFQLGEKMENANELATDHTIHCQFVRRIDMLLYHLLPSRVVAREHAEILGRPTLRCVGPVGARIAIQF